jgi:hypothetical protein
MEDREALITINSSNVRLETLLPKRGGGGVASPETEKSVEDFAFREISW